MAYENSGIRQKLNLVRAQEIRYTEAGDSKTDLDRLVDTADGFLDSVPSLRRRYKADITTLFVANAGEKWCGYGMVMDKDNYTYFADSAYNVVEYDCTGNFTYAHELGHNMGAAHDSTNATVAGLYDFSFGYRNPDRKFRTVMAYDCGDTPETHCSSIPYFSNPRIPYEGDATGVADSSDNALTLNSSRFIVSRFRDGTPPLADFSMTTLTIPTSTMQIFAPSTPVSDLEIGNAFSKTFTLGSNATDTAYWQSFTPTQNSIYGVSLALSRAGGQPPSLVQVYLKTTDNKTLGVLTLDRGLVPEGDPAWIRTNFHAPISVASGTSYYMEVYAYQRSSLRYYKLGASLNSYAGGTLYLNNEAQDGYDLMLKVHYSRGAAGGGDTVQTVPSPVVNSFFATPETVTRGQTSTLSWDISGSSNQYIMPDIGFTSASGTFVITPFESGDRTLTAVNSAGVSVQRSVHLTVLQRAAGSPADSPSGATSTSPSNSPTITVLYPRGGETIPLGSSQRVRVVVDGNILNSAHIALQIKSADSPGEGGGTIVWSRDPRAEFGQWTVANAYSVCGFSSIHPILPGRYYMEAFMYTGDVTNSEGGNTCFPYRQTVLARTRTEPFTIVSAITPTPATTAVSSTPTTTPTPTPSIGATIYVFEATPMSTVQGQPVTLGWKVDGAATVSINNGVGNVQSDFGSVIVYPSTPVSTYTMTATDPAGRSTTKSINVYASPGATTTAPPIHDPYIYTFNASPATIPQGTATTLSWDVGWSTSRHIDPGVGSQSQYRGSTNVSPSVTTTYTLTAANSAGITVTTSTTVFVTAASTGPAPTPPLASSTVSGSWSGFPIYVKSELSPTSPSGLKIRRGATGVLVEVFDLTNNSFRDSAAISSVRFVCSGCMPATYTQEISKAQLLFDGREVGTVIPSFSFDAQNLDFAFSAPLTIPARTTKKISLKIDVGHSTYPSDKSFTIELNTLSGPHISAYNVPTPGMGHTFLSEANSVLTVKQMSSILETLTTILERLRYGL